MMQILHALATCIQVPSPGVVIRHLGLYYYWSTQYTIPVIRMVCHVGLFRY